jgi:hypothetical protein
MPSIFAYASDPEISRLVAWPRHETIETSRRFAAQVVVGYAEGGHYEWGLVRRTDQAFLGTCGFGEVDLARRRRHGRRPGVTPAAGTGGPPGSYDVRNLTDVTITPK